MAVDDLHSGRSLPVATSAVYARGCDGEDASPTALVCQSGGVVTTEQEASVSEVSTIGLDLAKHVFQAHGADASGKVVFRKRLRREKVLEFFAGKPACVVAMEACSSAHHWARELARLGHIADSGDVARSFRDHVARCSDMMSLA